MKKITLLYFTWIFFVSTAIAQNQTFSIIPGIHITEQIGLDEFKHFRVEIEHPQVDEASFGWKLIENTFLNKWYYSSCDNYGCYSGIPDSSMFGPLPDSVNGFIRITLNANSQAGTGIVKLYIYDGKYPEDGQYVTFEITSTEITTIAEMNDSELSVFPNPFTDLIHVKSNSGQNNSFTLINQHGKVLLELEVGAKSTKTFDVSHLTRGVYFASFGNSLKNKSIKIIRQ